MSKIHDSIKTVLMLGLIVLSYGVGAWLERMDTVKQKEFIARHCTSSATIDRYISKGIVGYVCFSQNGETKRISKTILVIDGI